MPSVAYAQASCVTATEPYRPHPHGLVHLWQEVNSENFARGVVNAQVRPHYPVLEFKDIWLQYTPREDIKEALAIRKTITVDPFNTPEWQDWEIETMDLETFRLCFQVFIKDAKTERLRGICTVVSNPIFSSPEPTEEAEKKSDCPAC